MEITLKQFETEKQSLAEFLRKDARCLGSVFVVAAVSSIGLFSDFRNTENDARALAESLAAENSATDNLSAIPNKWQQIVIYQLDDANCLPIDQIDLTARDVSTDAPLLEPLPS